jgi:2-phosphoglycerate kinase
VIYFLGGPPRVGKSIIGRSITSKGRINVVSTDSLGAVLENVLDSDLEPGLFVVNRFYQMCVEDRIELLANNPADRINDQIEENRAVWKAVVPFVHRERDEGRDVVVEGVAVLPELVNQLEGVDFRVVFIGNQGSAHKENIKWSARENGHDWMRDASDRYIEAFAVFVKEMSRTIEREARLYGYPYIEMSRGPFDDAVRQVVDSLLER